MNAAVLLHSRGALLCNKQFGFVLFDYFMSFNAGL